MLNIHIHTHIPQIVWLCSKHFKAIYIISANLAFFTLNLNNQNLPLCHFYLSAFTQRWGKPHPWTLKSVVVAPINLFSKMNHPGSFYSSLTDRTSALLAAFLRSIPFCSHLSQHSWQQNTHAERTSTLKNRCGTASITSKNGINLCFFLKFAAGDAVLHLLWKLSPQPHKVVCLMRLPVAISQHFQLPPVAQSCAAVHLEWWVRS